MADTRASVSDTTDAPDANDTTDASDSSADSAADEVSTVVVLAIKSRRIGHLSAGAKRILGYLSAWQLSLIACNLLLVVSSGAMHTRPHLVLPGRHFYCLYWHFTLALALWDGFSVAVLVRRRPDNLNTITLLSTSGLLLILMDVFIFCQLLLPPPLGHYHSSGTKTKSENISGYLTPILEHSEVQHHCLLAVSRIVCFLLWIHFANGQLRQSQWTYLQRLQTEVQADVADLLQIFSEFA
ncbi:hypothetical protein TYRP_010969 [Tyrophagus putrescentiae]|nr:hypothetical protein TYRP_010969 [Tyrophagus putrescentiae]